MNRMVEREILLKRYKCDKDISVLWDAFRNDTCFHFENISGLSKTENNTWEFFFLCKKTRFSIFSIPEFNGKVESNEEQVSYVEFSTQPKSKRTLMYIALLASNLLLMLRIKTVLIVLFILLSLIAIYFDRRLYKKVLQRDTGMLENQYELKLIEDKTEK